MQARGYGHGQARERAESRAPAGAEQESQRDYRKNPRGGTGEGDDESSRDTGGHPRLPP